MVRPRQKSCIQFWAPQHRKDAVLLQLVHHKASETIKGWTYEERLRELELFGLEKRRLKGDLIIVYKYLIGESEEMANRFLSVVPTDRTRGNGDQFKRVNLSNHNRLS